LKTITAIILSGGRATRMCGLEKGLVLLHNKTLVAHVIDRLTPQVDEILINANRELTSYHALNLPILQDENPDFIGPLAGFSLGLQHCKHDYLLTVPCDSPLLPLDLAQRLLTTMSQHQADIAVASSSGNAHPVFSLCKKSVLLSLTDFINQGGRKVSAWQKGQAYIEVDFNDRDDAFINLNTLEDLASLELKLNHE
jgi:molybdopterin-guanine dinucleotide biosynthesis protein A